MSVDEAGDGGETRQVGGIGGARAGGFDFAGVHGDARVFGKLGAIPNGAEAVRAKPADSGGCGLLRCSGP